LAYYETLSMTMSGNPFFPLVRVRSRGIRLFSVLKNPTKRL
jgi:hypothetical protein